MILAIDIGNSNIVLGCIEGKTIAKEARIATDLIKTSDQYMAELKNMLDLFEIPIASIEEASSPRWCRRCSTPSRRRW